MPPRPRCTLAAKSHARAARSSERLVDCSGRWSNASAAWRIVLTVTCKLLGPRLGKYNADGTPNPIPRHSIPMAVVGTFILCFGWFGFNSGSTLSATDTRFAIIAVNTMLASAAGTISATFYAKLKFGKPDPTWMCNGMLAGLVAITAPCAFVSPQRHSS
jgi:Amt family ammonium transporter